MIQVFVPGIPQPQGSKNAYVRGSRAVLVEANKKLPAWRKLVTEKLEAANVSCQPLENAVTLEVIFFFQQAKSNKKSFPAQKPDTDKLIRAINDSGTDAGIFKDDSQVVEIIAKKLWATEETPPGALIEFREFYGVSYFQSQR